MTGILHHDGFSVVPQHTTRGMRFGICIKGQLLAPVWTSHERAADAGNAILAARITIDAAITNAVLGV